MFFIEASGEPAADSAAPWPTVCVELGFDGDPPGVFRMSLARAAAAQIAADFLGEDAGSLTGRQVDEVAKELANMICGAVLSRIESRATFRLAAPGIVPGGVDARGAVQEGIVCAFETGSGMLTAGIHMGIRECSPIARSES